MTVIVSVEMGGTSATSSSAALTALGAASSTVVGALPKVTSIVYPGDDQAANNIGGQTLYLNGSGFLSNSNVYINGNAVPSKSFISASNIQFTTPNLTNGIYPVYVVNYDGSTALLVPGIVISSEPSWNTAAGSLSSSQDASSAWSYSLSANGDGAITYALAAGSSLPTGISLASNGLISGTITSPPAVETTYTFSVVATDAQLQDATRQFSVTATVGEGVLFANNVLLMHADGTNNGNNHAFLDSSNNNFTITRNGNATQGTFSPFSQTGWSNYVSSNNYLSIADNAAFQFGSGDYTIECWVNISAMAGAGGIFGYGPVGGLTNSWGLEYVSGNNALSFWNNNANPSTYIINGTINPINNRWTHIAVCRSGNNTRLFINGVQDGATYTSTYTNGTGYSFYIGAGFYAPSTRTVTGYISNLRIVKGTGLYTSNFTPSAAPLTAVSGTTLLTCQANRFIDASSNTLTIVLGNAPTIQPYSPFAPSAAYSTANIGGSGYFDGSGDYLTSTISALSGDFTIEFWLYRLGSSSTNVYNFNLGDSAAANSLEVYIGATGSTIYLYSNNAVRISSSTTVPVGVWSYFAVTRSGSTVTLYLNGVSLGTWTSSATFSTSLTIGAEYYSSTYYSSEKYLGPFRISNNVRTVTTIPTAPWSNDANTVFLCNFTNAQIYDQSSKQIFECVGTAKVSTSVFKYGTGSIDFSSSANDSYLITPTTINNVFGTGDFTIEGWIYPTSTTTSSYCDGNATLFDMDASAGTGTDWWVMHQVNAGFTFGTNSAVVAQSTTGLTANQWSHFAITRSGSTIRIFTNGTISNTATYSTTIGANRKLSIGKQVGFNRFFKGYLDDLRITKGYARYTTTFTPSTSAFKDR